MNHLARPIRHHLVWMCALLAFGCKKSAPEPTPEQKSSGSAQAPASTSSARASADSKAQAKLAAETKPKPPPLEEDGIWVESDKYEFKLVSAEYCEEPQQKTSKLVGKNPTEEKAASDATTTPEGMVLLGVKMQVKPKVGEFFVAPKHATVYQGGLRFEPKIGREARKCTPLLEPIMLKQGDIAAGFVVFEVPAKHKKLELNYQPVRWGGAGPVRVAVPKPGSEKQARTARK